MSLYGTFRHHLEISEHGHYRPIHGYNHHVHPPPHPEFDLGPAQFHPPPPLQSVDHEDLVISQLENIHNQHLLNLVDQDPVTPPFILDEATVSL